MSAVLMAAEEVGAKPVNVAPLSSLGVEDIWSVKVPEFRGDAVLVGEPIVLYFTADWCGYCKQMERTTLSNGSVQSRLAPFDRVKVDFDKQPELVARYQIRGVPAFVMVNARGEEIARLVGMTEPDPFRAWLEESRTRAIGLAKAFIERQAELKTLGEQLDGRDGDAWEKVKARVFELAARGEAYSREFALKQLTARAQMKPSALFDGLRHPDLAVRVAVAGVLKKTLGDRFVYDPWADAATREAVIRKFVLMPGISVEVEFAAWFVEFSGAPAAGSALEVLLTAGGESSPDGRIVGFLSVEQRKAVFSELEAMKSAEIIATPKVSAGSGNPVNMIIGQEMRYPTRWEPDASGKGWKAADFETRTVGVALKGMAQTQADGTLKLVLSPKCTRLAGFIDTVTTPATAGMPVSAEGALAEGKPLELTMPATPIFIVRELDIEVTVQTGLTAVLRGGEPQIVTWAEEKDVSKDRLLAAERARTRLVFVTAKIATPRTPRGISSP